MKATSETQSRTTEPHHIQPYTIFTTLSVPRMSATVAIPMNVLDRARASGKLPPSLLQADLQNQEDGFETALLKVIASDGTSVARCCSEAGCGVC